MALLGKVLNKVLPRQIYASLIGMKILTVEYGYFNSAAKWSCLDKGSKPIPWYTYSAIEYLKQLDFADKKVFEYGSGNSTLFWAELAEQVTSIESDKNWYEKISPNIQSNAKIHLIDFQDKAYVKEINKFHEGFDVIVIDGYHRYECAQEAIRNLKSGGMIILDNSDWFIETAKFLRECDLIQVDMSGFGPINPYTWTTSLFLRRDFNFKPKGLKQPNHCPGAIKNEEEPRNKKMEASLSY